MKQNETLEEAAENYNLNTINAFGDYESFIAGAKWMQERSYSEEDLKEAYFSAIKSTGEGWNGEYANGNNPNVEEEFKEGFKEWFELFINK
jgi:hypothetical protein